MVMLVSAGVFLAGMIYGVYKMMEEEGEEDGDVY